jgi:hypothetical protein
LKYFAKIGSEVRSTEQSKNVAEQQPGVRKGKMSETGETDG